MRIGLPHMVEVPGEKVELELESASSSIPDRNPFNGCGTLSGF